MKSLAYATVFAAVLVALNAPASHADPLPGEVLKFQQLPLNDGQPPFQTGAQFTGHDEWSTAYANYDPNGVLQDYRGTYMADDFGDKVSTPVVHVRWWGSYDQNFTGNNGVQNFLISFESDVPAIPGTFSHPGVPLLNQVVTTGPLSSGSGTFTEKLVNGSMSENLYEYNAELALPFSEQADSVYWLKIVALVDSATEGMMNWGWHTRDWSLQNTYASTSGLSTPGETMIGSVVDNNGTPLPVWHYQDDAVTGPVTITPTGGVVNVNQFNTWSPLNYIDGIDGPLSPGGIGQYSMDLAFELYTTPVPEPSTLAMLGIGLASIAGWRWRQRRQVG